METQLRILELKRYRRLPLVIILAGIPLAATAVEERTDAAHTDTLAVATADEPAGEDHVAIEAIETATADASTAPKEVAWLGVSASEASEALSSQLDLQPGVGLVVTYLAPDSPAAKAGLKKNDVLVQFEDQSLVHPAQLRKLVRVHKEGDAIKLVFYRSGKQKTISVTLGKTAAGFGSLDDEGALRGNLSALEKQLKDLHIDAAVREQMKAMRDSLGNIKIDQKKVQQEIRRSMDDACKAVQEALRNVTNADFALNPVRKALENLAGSGVLMNNNATVTVRSSGKGVKSLVKTDESGTVVLVNRPKLRLTAHDKEGELVFDGEIETSEQRHRVPRELWKRVEPLLEKMNANSPEEPEPKDEQ